jgi:hypothetical protein
VARRNRDPSRPSASRADWLGREQTTRKRPWALEEQLFGCGSAGGHDERLRALAGRLSDERSALSLIETELRQQIQRVSKLEWQLEAIAAENGHGVEPLPASAAGHAPSKTVLRVRSTSPPDDRDYWLSRCEGFLVESPTGRGLGVVEGLRFSLRIDRPDLIEVGAGLLRRRVLLVPVDDVESISGDEERVVLNTDPFERHALTHKLLARARATLRISPS